MTTLLLLLMMVLMLIDAEYDVEKAMKFSRLGRSADVSNLQYSTMSSSGYCLFSPLFPA